LIKTFFQTLYVIISIW